MWECHSDGRNLTKRLNLLSIFLDFYELKRNWGSKTNIQQKKISQYPALLISHLLITHIYLIYISSSNRVERLATVKVDPSHWKSICKTLRKYSASNYQGVVENVVESNDSSQLMSTRHAGSRFERHFENFPQVATKGGYKYCRIDSNRTTRHGWCRPVIPEVDLQDT